MRAFYDKLYCRYDREIGILSLGYKLSDLGSSFDDLVKTLGLLKTSLYNYCGGLNPTAFISMIDDPAWLLNFVESLRFPVTTEIALIDVKKLELMGIVYGQART